MPHGAFQARPKHSKKISFPEGSGNPEKRAKVAVICFKASNLTDTKSEQGPEEGITRYGATFAKIK